MRIRTKSTLFALLLSASCLFGANGCFLADAQESYWEGVDSFGVTAVGTYPVVIERQTFTIDVPNLPSAPFSVGQFVSYAVSSTAEYVFYNPAQTDVVMTLYAPFGRNPCYFPYDDAARYSVSVGGEQADGRVRYAYAERKASASTTAIQDRDAFAFFTRSRAVTEYTISLPVSAQGYLKCEFDCNPKNTRVLFEDSAYYGIRNGRGAIVFSAAGEHKIYAVGDPLENLTQVFTRDAAGNVAETAVSDSELSVLQTDFGEFSMRGYRDGYSVPAEDWYFGFVEMLDSRTVNGYMVCDYSMQERDFERWYEYSLTVPAGGRATSTICAPLYPTIDGESHSRYGFSFLLSPAQKWTRVEQTEIYIRAPYALSNSSLQFEKTESGYAFSRDALPQGELTFILTKEGNASSGPWREKEFLRPAVTAAFVMLLIFIVVALSVTVFVILFFRSKSKRKDKDPPHEKTQ